MSVRRVFLDWNRPGLAAAAEYLRQTYAAAGVWPLEQLVVVFPGRRAGRRFLEILVQAAEEHALALTPPRITTTGKLPDLLDQNSRRVAGPLSCQLAWIAALRGTEAARLKQVIPELPPHDEPARWAALAKLFGQLHDELTAHGLRFADVAERGFEEGKFDERARWLALAEVQESYERCLREAGMADSHLARLAAIAAGNCRLEGEIVLVGVADANPALLEMLAQAPDRVTALVHAPASLAHRFTAWGTVLPEAWLEAPIELDRNQIVVVEGPADQAEAAVRAIAEYEGRFAAEEISIGVPDRDVVPYLEQRLEQFELPSRYGDGFPMRSSGPYRLLAAAAAYLESGAFADLASLARHPDVESWLAADQAASLLSELDRYYSEHLQSKLAGRLLGGRSAPSVAGMQRKIDRWLGPFKGRRPLAQWAEEIAALLLEIYGRQDLSRNHADTRIAVEACELLHRALVEAASLDERLAGDWRAADAIRLVLSVVESEPIPPLPDHEAIELLGWLELPLDDAPALIVTGFNDGLTPSHVNADLFLPGALRHRLKLNDNDRRYARDAYALSVLAASRERLTLIAGRRTAVSDPLSPSRLLFACDRPTIAARTLAFFGDAKPAETIALPRSLSGARGRSAFAVPKPQPLQQPIASMRVTEFRDYLACPYRYYLRHVLGLNRLDDGAEELDPGAFGSLAHAALQAFGQDKDANRSTDPAAIRSRLDAALDEIAAELYGKSRLPAVEVQIEQLRLRLHAFAEWQARWAAEGWRILHAEAVIEDDRAPLIVDGQPMFLRARIDRVDVNENTGRSVIFDYKTSDKGKSPGETHRTKDQWIDLQLPLYRHLAAALNIKGPVDLGYIVLPKTLGEANGHLANWTEAELAAADEAAAEVVRGIRGELFWRPASPPPAFSDEFGPICQDGQLGGPGFDEESN